MAKKGCPAWLGLAGGGIRGQLLMHVTRDKGGQGRRGLKEGLKRSLIKGEAVARAALAAEQCKVAKMS